VADREVVEWLRKALSQPGPVAYRRARRHRPAARRLLWVAERLAIEGAALPPVQADAASPPGESASE
jgi:hypothetical protein